MAALRSKTQTKHYVVEHDKPNDLERLISRSIAAFKTY